METTLLSLALGFSVAFQPANLWYAFLGCLVGTLVGVLPGIGPLAGISILLPVTFGLNATQAIIMLAGIYYGSQYGGSTTSILMRIPGEASSVMTCIDGYAMAKKGRAGAALCIAAVGSWIGGTFGVLVLTVVAPPLATIAVRFGPPEYTALLVLGLIFLAYMSSSSLIRTLLMACLGLLLGMIGIDNMTGHFRYSFDLAELGDGIGIVPVAVGLFGLGEILSTPSAQAVGEVIAPKLRDLLPTRQEWREAALPIARGTCSASSSASSRAPRTSSPASCLMRWSSRVSKHPEQFGKGAVAGVAGPESANNSASTGAFVPMLALGIPTSPITAVLIGALMIHGVPAGPTLVTEHPDVFWGFVASMYVGNLMLLLLNLPLVSLFVTRAADSLRLSLSADHHVLHHRRLRSEPLDRRRLDHADHGRARLRAAQIRIRSGAAGARPRDRADPGAEPAPVADHVERQLFDLLQPADLAGAVAGGIGLLALAADRPAQAQGLAQRLAEVEAGEVQP